MPRTPPSPQQRRQEIEAFPSAWNKSLTERTWPACGLHCPVIAWMVRVPFGFGADSPQIRSALGSGAHPGRVRPAAQEFRCHRGTLTIKGFRRADWPCFPTCPRLSSSCSWSGSGICKSCSPSISPIWPKRTAFAPFPSSPRAAPCSIATDACSSIAILHSASFCFATIRSCSRRSLPQIEEGLGISKEDLEQQLDAAKLEPKFLPVIIKPAASRGGHRLRRIAPRRSSRARTDDGPAPPLPARRHAREHDRLRW